MNQMDNTHKNTLRTFCSYTYAEFEIKDEEGTDDMRICKYLI